MKDFFKSELRDLKAKTGLNQYQNISEMPDAQRQFSILLDSMVMVCKEFDYIPENDQKRIIQEQIVRDQDFTGLNSRVIWKWLNANKDHYWTIHQMKQEPTSHEIAPPEVADRYAKQLLEAISKIGNVTTPQPREERFDKSVSVGANIPMPTKEDIEQKELHRQYLLQNYDPLTGKKKDCWIDEKEWLELMKED